MRSVPIPCDAIKTRVLSMGRRFQSNGVVAVFLVRRVNGVETTLAWTNSVAFVPGQFVRVLLSGSSWTEAIQVPQRAVMQGPQGNFVWVVDAESKAQFRPVTVGQLMNDRWIIAEGLQPGERVVVDGGIKLAPGVTIKPVEPDAAGVPATATAPGQG